MRFLRLAIAVATVVPAATPRLVQASRLADIQLGEDVDWMIAEAEARKGEADQAGRP